MARIHVNDIELYYISGGQRDQTVLLSHGALMDHGQFAPQWDLLAERYRVVAYDHRGHGKSDDATNTCNLELLTADAAELIKALGVGAVHFVGCSIGARVGLQLAIRHPELLRSLTVISVSPLPTPWRERLQLRMLRSRVALSGLSLMIEPVLELLFGANTRRDPGKQSLLVRWRDKLTALTPTKTKHTLSFLGQHDNKLLLSAITCPTLVLFGSQDPLTPAESAWALASSIVGCEVFRIENAGHCPNLEQPDDINAALTDFLAKSSSAP